MPKIDFDSDSAPFSGAVLPTIEDVAALGDRLEKEVVDPIPRIDPARATTVQRMVLPFTFALVAVVAVALHLTVPSASPADSADSVEASESVVVQPENIPLEGARDVRVIALSPTTRDMELALRATRTARVTVVYSKDSPPSPASLAALTAARVTLYPAPPSMIPSEGALLDGLRWFPLRPQSQQQSPPPPAPPSAASAKP
jgi:hypothetical protein